MENENPYDPEAPMGFCGEGENRRPITYPCPTWFESHEAVINAINTDPGARWYFRNWEYTRQLLQQQQQAPPPPPQQPFVVVAPAPAPPALPASAETGAPPQSLLQQQQQPLRPLPIFPGPRPGQTFDRWDRAVGCLYCLWWSDRRSKATTHLAVRHPGQNPAEGVGWVDWEMVRPRYR